MTGFNEMENKLFLNYFAAAVNNVFVSPILLKNCFSVYKC